MIFDRINGFIKTLSFEFERRQQSLISLWILGSTAFSAATPAFAKTIDEYFHCINQKIYPHKDSGVHETTFLGELADGRIFTASNSGDVFLFNGTGWDPLALKFPKQTSRTYTDNNGRIWIGGEGFFGYFDDQFQYVDLSGDHFKGQLDSQLPVMWIYETDGWIHFANNKAMYHYHSASQKAVVSEFDGMFDAYHWMTDGELYLGRKDRIQVWRNDRLVDYQAWTQEYRAFTGWKYEGRDYFLNAFKLYVYEDGVLVEEIKDELMKMRGADHIKTDHCVCILTYQGILKINFDGSCEGYYEPWYQQKISSQSISTPAYFGGDDIWFLTDFAIFQVELGNNRRTLGLDTGIPITGCWDITEFNGDIYTASTTGFEKHISSGVTEVPENAPDFETFGIWKSFNRLFISTWIEVGGFAGEKYSIEITDNSFRLFAPSSREDALWVSSDEGVWLISKDFEVLRQINDADGEITSLLEFDDCLWFTTSAGSVFRADSSNPDASEVVKIEYDSSVKTNHVRLLRASDRLFLQNKEQLFLWKENAFEETKAFEESGWEWDLPAFSSDYPDCVLVQRNVRFGGCKVGLLTVSPDGELKWDWRSLNLEASANTLRTVKKMEGVDGDVIAFVSPAAIELIDISQLPLSKESPAAPELVASAVDLGNGEVDPLAGIYHYDKNKPLVLQLHSDENTLQNPVSYIGRLKGWDNEWVESPTGEFTFHGLLRGHFEFQGYAVDAFGNRSELLNHSIRVIPKWYLTNLALFGYLILLVLLIVFVVHWRTVHLRERSKQLEAMVAERTEDLVRANQAKSIFVSNVSHEIRNPMNGLLGLARSLRVGDVVNEDTLNRLRKPSFYLHRFLSNVLDFSKFESGGIRFSLRLFNPNDLLSSLDSIFSGEISERKLTFSADYRFTDSQFLVSSQEAIEIVLVNLVGNAIKYTPEGGSIRVALLQENQELFIAVSDSGVGISKEDQEKIFKPFEQGTQRSLIAGEKGAGIGLSLVFNTLQQLDGRVWVESEEGAGATFYARVPVLDAGESDFEGEIDQVKLTGRFLVVEDLEYNLKLFADMLKEWGADVDVAMSGNEAVELGRKKEYNMVFVDYDLPDINGSEVTAQFRRLEHHKDTSIIGLSAYTGHEFIEASLQSGMDDFQFKPLNVQKIAECILKFEPDLIDYTIKEFAQSNESRVNLNRIRTLAGKRQDDFHDSVNEYLNTFHHLVKGIKVSDVGSEEFESLLHQLKGHCAFINHQSSVLYCSELHEMSRKGLRMELLDQLDRLPLVAESIVQQVKALQLLEEDFQSLSDKTQETT